MSSVPVPTREEILAHGFPEGFLDRQRERAQVARARAIGALFASLVRSLVPRGLPPDGTGLAST